MSAANNLDRSVGGKFAITRATLNVGTKIPNHGGSITRTTGDNRGRRWFKCHLLHTTNMTIQNMQNCLLCDVHYTYFLVATCSDLSVSLVSLSIEKYEYTAHRRTDHQNIVFGNRNIKDRIIVRR